LKQRLVFGLEAQLTVGFCTIRELALHQIRSLNCRQKSGGNADKNSMNRRHALYLLGREARARRNPGATSPIFKLNC
jgi:hypothetical protein